MFQFQRQSFLRLLVSYLTSYGAEQSLWKIDYYDPTRFRDSANKIAAVCYQVESET